jgi:hypothetical protein
MSLELDRYEPIKAWMQANPPRCRSLQRALKSNSAKSNQIQARLAKFLEDNKDTQNVQTFIENVLSNDDVVGANALVDSLHVYLPLVERAKGIGKPNPVNPHTIESTSGKVKTSEQRRVATNPNKPDVQPTALERLNQPNGEVDIQMGENRTVIGRNQNPAVRANKDLKNQEETAMVAPKGTQQFQPNTVTGYDANGKPIFGTGTMNADDIEADRSKDNYAGKGSQGLRDMFEEADGEDLGQTDKERFASNLQFELFSYVPPGFGNGIDNKLFRMDVNRKRLIEWDDPMNQHRAYDGPTCGVTPLPYQWQNDMTDENYSDAINMLASGPREVMKAKKGPIRSSLLGEVFYQPSSKGLPQSHPTFLQKAINVTEKFHNPVTPCGAYLREPNIRNIDPLVTPNATRYRQRNSLSENYAYQSTYGINWMQ